MVHYRNAYLDQLQIQRGQSLTFHMLQIYVDCV